MTKCCYSYNSMCSCTLGVCRSVGHSFIVMNDSLFAPGQPVTYQRYTNNEFVPARVFGPSTRGEQYIHIVYERNGHEQEHHAPLERVSFPIRSPSPSDGAPSPPMPATCVLQYVPRANTGLSKHGDLVFPHFWSWNQNLARVCARGGRYNATFHHMLLTTDMANWVTIPVPYYPTLFQVGLAELGGRS